ncbi:hypothetical protein FZC84_08395 [Rossellomorea vietnamensis]|uniref:Uncharacterized protein n=1 Tax=Rossellomorea vietnamensis TaxID=218284 RepID=A0A5D4MED6_9BACI|nr:MULTISPECIES: DUF2161 family putative PD-(D/E)XK-type phosphodiesterase [Bacillaceae]TYR99827.1 hypothetical protein FZC84_08395 [Rossellomorea vietnamensis]
MSAKKKIIEADLYRPIQKHFTQEGYKVNGEVKDCDLTAVKGGDLIIVELKLNLTVDLLIQAAKRQRLTDLVYIAIPRPKNMRSRRWKDICHLVRRLELGLITVSVDKKVPKLQFIQHPEPFDFVRSQKASSRRRNSLLAEIEGRSADYNVGGTNKTKIMTAYKETCIMIACCLEQYGRLAPKDLVKMGAGNKTQSILSKNYYKWFERVDRGIYEITEKGKKELRDFPELKEYYTHEIIIKKEEMQKNG